MDRKLVFVIFLLLCSFVSNIFAENNVNPTSIQIANYYYQHHILINLSALNNLTATHSKLECTCKTTGTILVLGGCAPQCGEISETSKIPQFPIPKYDPAYIRLIQIYKLLGYK